MVKIGICGHFGTDEEFIDGQTIKTKILKNTLQEKYGEKNIYSIDTYNWKKNPFKLFFKCVVLMRKCENVIFMPSVNGVKVFVPLFSIINKIYNKKIFYFVIGSRLDKQIEKNSYILKYLFTITKIYVETYSLKEKLNGLGLKNVDLILNFKNIKVANNIKKMSFDTEPYKLCTFSRVTALKGIKEAIEIVLKINENSNKIIYTLDIYGQIDKEFEEEFKSLIKNTPETIQYKGIIKQNATDTLEKYFALLFPTKYYDEGVPGTIIDAYAAGLPVISSNWESASQVIKHKFTGYLYEFNNFNRLYTILESISSDPSIIISMRANCLNESQNYNTKNALIKLYNEIEA